MLIFFLYVFIFTLQMFHIPSWPWITKRAREAPPLFHRAKWKCIITIPSCRGCGIKKRKKKKKEIHNSSCWQIHLAISTRKPKISSSCSSSALSYELFAGCSPPRPSSLLLMRWNPSRIHKQALSPRLSINIGHERLRPRSAGWIIYQALMR